MIKAIVFDMDGVIFDTENLFIGCWKSLAEEIQIEDLETVLRKCIGTNEQKTREIMIAHYGDQFDFDHYRERVREIFTHTVETQGMPLKKGVYELLDFLKAKGYRIGLASSTRVETIRRELRSVGLEDYFEVIIGGNMVTHSKPHPEIYRLACEKLGIHPEEAIAIEDSLNGIRSAYDAGLKPIMVPDLIQPTKEIQPLLYQKFNDLLEVKNFIEEQAFI